jgi:hypothetical protein
MGTACSTHARKPTGVYSEKLTEIDHMGDVGVRGVTVKFPECPHICRIG